MSSYPWSDRRALIALGATAAVVAATTTAVLSKKPKKNDPLVRDHSNIAKHVTDIELEEAAAKSSDSSLPEYDIVIIGGGTAGCALAARLSEDPSVSVLLLEAGGSGTALPFSLIPAGFTMLFHTSADYDIYTVPQQHAGNKAKYWPRAKMLGGCSAINAMMAHQGHPSDYDEWSKIIAKQDTADSDIVDSWKYERLKHYFLKFEKWNPSQQFPDVDAKLRGSSGQVSMGYFGNFSKVAQNWLKAVGGIGIPISKDFNTVEGTMGAGKVMTYICDKRKRCSAERAYLTPTVLARKNLKVAIYAQTTRILFDDKKAVGVEFLGGKGANAKTYRVKAKREIVLSAGAVHSPQILMLSGVGPAEHLKSHNISVVHDLPGVGQHLQDHQTVNVRYKTKSGLSLNYLRSRTPMEYAKAFKTLMQYNMSGSGDMTCNVGEAACFLSSNDRKLFPKEQYPKDIEDSASMPNGPDIEIICMPMAFTEHGFGPIAKGESMSMSATLLRPTTKGTVTLSSRDPTKPPVVDPQYCETQHDVDVLARGIRLMTRIAKEKPLANLLLPDTTNSPYLDDNTASLSDAEIEKIARERCETLYHPTSSCRMAPLSEGGVVDEQLRVYGLQNLRIADASVFPTIISGHTQAPAMAVGEKCADLMKGIVV